MGTPCPQRGQARVARDRIDPRGHGCAAVIGRQGTPDFDEHVLGHIFCRVAVAQIAVRQPENLTAVLGQQGCYRLIATIVHFHWYAPGPVCVSTFLGYTRPKLREAGEYWVLPPKPAPR